jgi:hypothetical protein
MPQSPLHNIYTSRLRTAHINHAGVHAQSDPQRRYPQPPYCPYRRSTREGRTVPPAGTSGRCSAPRQTGTAQLTGTHRDHLGATLGTTEAASPRGEGPPFKPVPKHWRTVAGPMEEGAIETGVDMIDAEKWIPRGRKETRGGTTDGREQSRGRGETVKLRGWGVLAQSSGRCCCTKAP